MLCIVAIVDCIQVSHSFLLGLVNIVQENTTVDVLIEDQLWIALDVVTDDQERELHKPNS